MDLNLYKRFLLNIGLVHLLSMNGDITTIDGLKESKKSKKYSKELKSKPCKSTFLANTRRWKSRRDMK